MTVPNLGSPIQALPKGLCFEDRGQGQIEIMPVMLSRAERWIEDLYLGNAFKPVVVVKQRRAALLTGTQKIRQLQLEAPTSTRKRKRKADDVVTELQNTIYWAPVDGEYAAMTEAFIDAMAVNSQSRTSKEERIIDTYWKQGMSLDPILKTETIDETYAYLKLDQKAWKTQDYIDRGIENGDLDGIKNGADALTDRATKHLKIASTASRTTSGTRIVKRI